MPKKPSPQSLAADLVGNLAGDPFALDARPPEILVAELALRPEQRLEWRFWLAGTPGRVLLNLLHRPSGAKVKLVDQAPPLPRPLTRMVCPPRLPASRYALGWGAITAGVDWQMCVELLIDGTFVFRHYKSGTSNEPLPTGFMPFEVL